jgi:hypothetical protein
LNSTRIDVIVAALVAVCAVAVLFIVILRRRGKRDPEKKPTDLIGRSQFDTTLGEFHDMRQALRPLQHTRATSRRVPGQQR